MEFEFKINLEVVNPACPEWGVGRILSVEPGNGGNGQRIRVNFDGVGVKTMMIPPGRLARVDEVGKPQPQTQVGDEVVKTQTNEDALASLLQAIPEVVGDRRAGLDVRLTALVKIYKYSDKQRHIFEWAMVQLACKDPLQNFSADELGLYFSNFCRNRDQALKELYREVNQMGLGEKFRAEMMKKASDEVFRRMCEVLGIKCEK